MTEESELTADDDGAALAPRDTVRFADAPRDTCDVSNQAHAFYRDLYDREYANVITLLMRYRLSLPDAQDAAQEAFLAAWNLIRTGRWSTGVRDPRAWIRGVALNNYRRPPGPRVRVPTVLVSELPEPAPADGDPSALPALAVSVITALSRLDEELRAVMVLTMDDMSAREVARALKPEDQPTTERDVQRVHDQVKKARRILSAELSASGKG